MLHGEIRPRIKDNTACKTKLENIDQLGALLCKDNTACKTKLENIDQLGALLCD